MSVSISGYSEQVINLLKLKYTPYKKQFISLGEIRKNIAEDFKLRYDLDISGYKHEINNYAIHHALKEHPNLLEIDFARIPEILMFPDEVFYEGKSRLGLHVIKYRKAFNGTTYYLEEIRGGKKLLGMKTMYKTKTPSSASYASKA